MHNINVRHLRDRVIQFNLIPNMYTSPTPYCVDMNDRFNLSTEVNLIIFSDTLHITLYIIKLLDLRLKTHTWHLNILC